ncbi:MAG: hypothetical protein J5616_05525 [Bacteroidaceae bacterium]|nr:hypothetical protein [Bacteroidaceae bacterium]
MKASFEESRNVQQTVGLTGQVNNQVQTVDTIVSEAVNQPSAEEQAKAERMELLWGLRIKSDTMVELEQYVLSVDGVGFFAQDDVHGLKSKQKAGKTSVLKVCSAALMSEQVMRVKSEMDSPVVLWLDTEQKPADVKAIVDDVKLLSGVSDDYLDEHFFLFPLRKMNYETLLGDTRMLIERVHPQVVLVDGVVDYVASFNDEVLSRQLIHELMMLAQEHHCAIVCVLHENKASDDENMRGHLGTVLAQKAGTVLQCHKSKQGIISVSCPDSRHGAMPEWSICYDAEGRLHDADEQHRLEVERERMSKKERQQLEKEQREKDRVDMMLTAVRESGGCISRKELTERLMDLFGVKRPTVATFITGQLGKTLVQTEDGIEVHPYLE